jgi:hypothetical protein
MSRYRYPSGPTSGNGSRSVWLFIPVQPWKECTLSELAAQPLQNNVPRNAVNTRGVCRPDVHHEVSHPDITDLANMGI